MKNANLALALFLATLAIPAPALNAQLSFFGKTDLEDDIVAMDAFPVTRNHGRNYASGAVAQKPDILVTIRKHPDAIAMKLLLANAGAKQDVPWINHSFAFRSVLELRNPAPKNGK